MAENVACTLAGIAFHTPGTLMDEAVQTFFADLVPVATIIFAVSSMLAVGFTYTPMQVIGALRSWRFVVLAVLANFVASLALAWALASLFGLGADHTVGLMVLAAAAGSPSLIKQGNLARGNIALASGLLVLLVVSTIVYLPVIVPQFSPGTDVSLVNIAAPLVLSMFVPLTFAMILARFFAARTRPLLPILAKVSNYSLLALVVATFVSNSGRIVDMFSTVAIPVALLFVVGTLAIGYLFGFIDQEQQFALAFGTAQRNVSAALVVTTQSILVAETTVMVVITAMAAMLILFPAAKLLGRYRDGELAADFRPAPASAIE